MLSDRWPVSRRASCPAPPPRARSPDISSSSGRPRARRCRCPPWRAPGAPGGPRRLRRLRFPPDHPVHERLNMEIAVAHMADDRRDEAGLLDVPLGLVDAFGQPGDRHADIGRHRFARPAAAPGRPNRHRAGPATAASAPRPCRPFERPAFEFRRDLAEPFRLLLHAGPGAVEFEEQEGALRQGQLGMEIDRPTWTSSSSSMRATGMPDWIVMMTARRPP